jgi:hypothetical protein
MGVLTKRNMLVLLLALSLAACASGSAIVTGTKRTPIDPSQVKLYTEAPAKYEVLGIVSATSGAGLTKQGSEDYAVQELKKQAAKLGANGVLLEATGQLAYASGTIGQTVSGKAIFVGE